MPQECSFRCYLQYGNSNHMNMFWGRMGIENTSPPASWRRMWVKSAFSPMSRSSIGKPRTYMGPEIPDWKTVWYTRETRKDMRKKAVASGEAALMMWVMSLKLPSTWSITDLQKTWGTCNERSRAGASLRKPDNVCIYYANSVCP